MKKKMITFVLLGLLAVGSIIPISASAAETWDYGINKSKQQWYNYYLHSSSKHYGSITKTGSGITYFGPTANAGGWSRLNLDVNGPYAVTYNKHIVK